MVTGRREPHEDRGRLQPWSDSSQVTNYQRQSRNDTPSDPRGASPADTF